MHTLHGFLLAVLFCPTDGTTAFGAANSADQVKVAGVVVSFVDEPGSATIAAEMLGRHKLRINVDLETEKQLKVAVQLPISGRDAWPVADVVVVDRAGKTVAAQHNGIEWHKFTIVATDAQHDFVIGAVESTVNRPGVFPENERHAVDSTTGAAAAICKWYAARRAALCIRFDDSHPTHLSTAIPALREYAFRGTFMINPGQRDERCPPRWRSAFHAHYEEWKAVAQRGDQEFANHSLHHRGAIDDADAEREIGGASEIIWRLFPQRSQLVGLNLGGGTLWTTKRPLRYYLNKYHLFEVTGSLGMDDVYGNRVTAFRKLLDRCLQDDNLGWAKIHYHSIGNGRASSEEHFRAVLDAAKEHEADLWITGLADAYKYLTERRAAKLGISADGPHRVCVQLSCSTDAALFDQPLTIKVSLPENWRDDQYLVLDANRRPLNTRTIPHAENRLLLFDVPPIDGEYSVERVSD